MLILILNSIQWMEQTQISFNPLQQKNPKTSILFGIEMNYLMCIPYMYEYIRLISIKYLLRKL